MKRFSLVLFATGLLCGVCPARAEAKIRAVATIPDLADMARRIGGDLLDEDHPPLASCVGSATWWPGGEPHESFL